MKNRTWTTLLLLSSLVGIVLHTASVRPLRNFHTVDPEKLYRSAQLNETELRFYIKKYGIKTIINLRGPQSRKEWFWDELKVAEELHVKHYSPVFNSTHVPRKKWLVSFLDIVDKAERPILVHCRSGADRTGITSAIYEIDVLGKPREVALKQISSKYLHTEFFKPANRHFIKNYLGSNWARNEYNECDPKFIKYAEKPDKCLAIPKTQ